MSEQPHHDEDEAFRKYSIGGAYHWKWYLVDFEGYRTFISKIAAHLPTTGTLFDVGCGDGLMSYAFFRRGLDVVGIDENELAIRLANHVSDEALSGKHGAVFAKDDFEPVASNAELAARRASGKLIFRQQTATDIHEADVYQHAICVEVIEHVLDPALVVEKVVGAVTDFAIFTTPDGTGEELGPYDHQLWTPESFAEFLSEYDVEFLDLRPGTLSAKIYKSRQNL